MSISGHWSFIYNNKVLCIFIGWFPLISSLISIDFIDLCSLNQIFYFIYFNPYLNSGSGTNMCWIRFYTSFDNWQVNL
jgi:hypothetical protein